MPHAGVVGQADSAMPVRRVRHLVAALVGGAAVAAGVLSMWNPWRLVALDRVPGIGAVLAGVAVSCLASWRSASYRPTWLRRMAAMLGWTATVLSVLWLLLFAWVKLVSPFGPRVMSERSVHLYGDISVVRRVWSTGALRACVELEVRSGHGLTTRHGPSTVCADVSKTGLDDLQIGPGNEWLTVSRVNGNVCSYTVDEPSLELVANSTADCESLGI